MKNIWLLLLLVSTLAQAQWVNDPAINTTVFDGDGYKYVPKIAEANNGNYFISWFGTSTYNSDDNINMNITLFDHNGNELWNDGHIILSDHPQNSWVDDYSLTTDKDGNAILVFSDTRNEDYQKDVFVYKINQEGENLWGEDGIELTIPESGEFNPQVAVSNDNSVFVAIYTEYDNGDLNKIVIHKIDDDGNLVWGTAGMSYSSTNSSWAYPRIVANNDGGFTLGFFEETGSFPAINRNIKALRCDDDGNSLWTSVATITDAGGVNSWDKIQMYSLKDGGAYFAWKDDRNNDNNTEVYCQYVNPDGEIAWTENGVLLGLPYDGLQLYESIAGLNSNNELTIVWNATNSNQSQAELRFQRISQAGELLDGDNGKTVIAMNAQQQPTFKSIQNGDTTYVFYNSFINGSTYVTGYYLMALNTSGEQIWTSPVEIGMSDKSKPHNDVAIFNPNQAVVCWSEEVNDIYSIVAQNVFLDGSMGSNETKIETVNAINENLHFLTFKSRTNELILKDIEDNEILTVHNIQGKMIYQKQAEISQFIGEQAPGMYIGTIKSKNGNSEQFKFVIM